MYFFDILQGKLNTIISIPTKYIQNGLDSVLFEFQSQVLANTFRSVLIIIIGISRNS
jgi:hypothetical protein